MVNKAHNSSLEKALKYLYKGLSDGVWANAERLPTLRELARGAAVATRSMSEAVRCFTEKGILSVVRRRGIFVGQLAHYSQPKQHTRPLWEKIRLNIELDIIEGVVGNNKLLPQIKELAEKYGTHRHTVRVALKALANEGIIQLQRRRYTVVRYPGNRKIFHPLLFIGLDNGKGGVYILNERFSEFVLTLEAEGSKRRFIIERMLLKRDDDWSALRLSSRFQKTDHGGYAIWINGMNYSKVHELIGVLATLNKPVAIIDEIGDFMFAKPPTRFLKIFKIASTSAGAQVGRYLLQLGHRNIAYISPYHNNEWSRLRLLGIQNVWLRANSALSSYEKKEGIEVSLNVFTCPDPSHNSEEQEPLLKKSRAITRQLLPIIPPVTANAVASDIWAGFHTEIVNRHLTPLLEAAASRKQITAWVGANDLTAFLALRFLMEKEIDVPAALSVIGFDNTEMSYQYDFSSYNFLFSDIAKQVIGFMINPEHQLYWNRSVINCDGMVIQRSSTGPRQGVI